MDTRTLSQMEYEDWRPKLSPAEIVYFRGLQNCTPTYSPGSLAPMSREQLSRYQGTFVQQPHASFLDSLLGGGFVSQ